MRVGIGVDAHRFAEGRPLLLGGVEIPSARGLSGHSDADVLTHALCDAILGACGLGDLGDHFPSTDPRWEGVSSLLLLAEVVQRMEAAGFAVENVDAVVIAQEPRLSGYRQKMAASLAAELSVANRRVSVKATTTDQMGFTGRGEGIAATAVILLADRQAGSK